MKQSVDWADPFLGNGATDLPEPKGIAAAWFWPKAQVGNTHPGACYPMGMVSACAYSGAYNTGYGLYRASSCGQPELLFEDYTATGFTHFQGSGTGATQTYYNYLKVVPTLHGPGQVGERWTLRNETATPGYYATDLAETGVRAELTVAPKAAMHLYTLPAGPEPTIALDLSSSAIDTDRRIVPTEIECHVLNDRTANGKMVVAGIPLHFHVEIEATRGSSGVWRGERPVEGDSLSLPGLTPETLQPCGVLFRLRPGATQQATVRVGFSLRSVEQARRNMGDLDGRSFDEVAADARDAWASHLDRIAIEGGTDDRRTIFYSALYHALIKPADFADESPFWSDDGPLFFDLATMWDMYKTQLPLVMAAYPERGSAIINSMLRVAEHFGWFPCGFLVNADNTKFDGQASALGHMTLADAQARGIDGVDWQRAKDLMAQALFVGQRGEAFLRDGYTHPFSHTLDLAYGAFCTAQMAQAVGDAETHREMRRLSDNWSNVFDRETGILGESTYYEGTAWNYSFRLFHNQAERLALAGGDEAFVGLLDRFFGYGALRIEAPDTSAENLYVQTATLNGELLDRAWLGHEEITNGGTLQLEMGDAPSKWGQEKRPPSYASA